VMKRKTGNLRTNKDLKGWEPEGNDREFYKPRETEIGQGRLGVTTSLRSKS
jgi:hypothetical protein